MKVSGRFLIDTNIIVDFFQGNHAISTNLAKGEIFIPSVVIGELYFGAYASGLVANRKKRVEEISSFSRNNIILEISVNTADFYGKIKSQLKLIGKPIPENDIWIAAIAKEHNISLVTRDSHFNYIDGLKIVTW